MSRSSNGSSGENGSGIRLGIDIGGTFTDAVFHDADGSIRTAKASTTPSDITQGVMEAIEKVEASVPGVDAFVHGTTVALNALLEGKTPKVGLITTRGFRDVLEIMRTNRPDMYNLQQQKPTPLVARRRRLEVDCRMNHLGETIEPVDIDQVRSIAEALSADGIESVAVCLLHAYANAEHERAVELALGENGSKLSVSISSEISRMSREFERTSTTVINAATKPIVSSYLERLEQSLAEAGFGGQVMIMQSNGGHMSAADARRRPVATLMSGPVGGVAGAAALTRRSDEALDLLTLDIGGTSADAAIIDKGDPVTRTVGHVGRWPVMVPMVDIEAIGAGGGSIARVDEFGALSVGPESAGAEPGPVSYGKGGTEPTVTDANLILGRINPGNFLGGAMQLDVEGARDAIEQAIAKGYGMSCEEAAEGVITVVNSNMVRFLREAVIGRGYDPRSFSLLAYGGAGPLHACELAEALELKQVLVPVHPGTFSAFGILTADARYDLDKMVMGVELAAGDLESMLSELEADGRKQLEGEGLVHGDVDSIRTAELRYVGQDHPLAVEFPAAGNGAGANGSRDFIRLAEDLFHEKHRRLYGFQRDDTPVELVRLQVSVIGRTSTLGDAGSGPKLPKRTKEPDATAMRAVHCEGDARDASIFTRDELSPADRISGPSVVEEGGSTTYVPPRWVLTVLEDGTLHLAALDAGSTNGKQG
jgi:N-methylhydantoinase A